MQGFGNVDWLIGIYYSLQITMLLVSYTSRLTNNIAFLRILRTSCRPPWSGDAEKVAFRESK